MTTGRGTEPAAVPRPVNRPGVPPRNPLIRMRDGKRMQVYILRDEGETVRFGLRDSDSTMVEPIIEFLNKDKNVVFARYIVDHPDLTDPILEVKVSSGSPKEAVKKAVTAVGDVFKNVSVN